MKRRHLTASQAAAIAVEALGLYEAEAKERQGARTDIVEIIPQSETGKARDHAGAAVGVSGRYVEDAKKIRESAPERFAAIKRGERKLGVLIPEHFKHGGSRFHAATLGDFGIGKMDSHRWQREASVSDGLSPKSGEKSP